MSSSSWDYQPECRDRSVGEDCTTSKTDHLHRQGRLTERQEDGRQNAVRKLRERHYLKKMKEKKNQYPKIETHRSSSKV